VADTPYATSQAWCTALPDGGAVTPVECVSDCEEFSTLFTDAGIIHCDLPGDGGPMESSDAGTIIVCCPVAVAALPNGIYCEGPMQ
jgi:hypothetical protein